MSGVVELRDKVHWTDLCVASARELSSWRALNGDGLLVVDFWAPWCKPCLAVRPLFHQAAEDPRLSAAVFVSVDVDKHGALADDEDVSSLPMFRAYSVVRGDESHTNILLECVGGVRVREFHQGLLNLVSAMSQ